MSEEIEQDKEDISQEEDSHLTPDVVDTSGYLQDYIHYGKNEIYNEQKVYLAPPPPVHDGFEWSTHHGNCYTSEERPCQLTSITSMNGHRQTFNGEDWGSPSHVVEQERESPNVSSYFAENSRSPPALVEGTGVYSEPHDVVEPCAVFNKNNVYLKRAFHVDRIHTAPPLQLLEQQQQKRQSSGNEMLGVVQFEPVEQSSREIDYEPRSFSEGEYVSEEGIYSSSSSVNIYSSSSGESISEEEQRQIPSINPGRYGPEHPPTGFRREEEEQQEVGIYEILQRHTNVDGSIVIGAFGVPKKVEKIVEEEEIEYPDFYRCVICCNAFDDGDHKPMSASCGHALCAVCTRKVDKCPFCRGPMEEVEIDKATMKEFEGWGRYILALEAKLNRIDTGEFERLRKVENEHKATIKSLKEDLKESVEWVILEQKKTRMQMRIAEAKQEEIVELQGQLQRIQPLARQTQSLAKEVLQARMAGFGPINTTILEDKGHVTLESSAKIMVPISKSMQAQIKEAGRVPSIERVRSDVICVDENHYALPLCSWMGRQLSKQMHRPETLFDGTPTHVPVYLVERSTYQRLIGEHEEECEKVTKWRKVIPCTKRTTVSHTMKLIGTISCVICHTQTDVICRTCSDAICSVCSNTHPCFLNYEPESLFDN